MPVYISPGVYADVKNEQTSYNKDIQFEQNNIERLRASIAAEQSIQTNNPALISAGEAQEVIINDQIKAQKAAIAVAQEALDAAKEEEASKAELERLSNIVNEEVAKLEALVANLQNVRENVDEWKEQLSSSNERLEEDTQELVNAEAKLKDLTDQYNEWFAKNGSIITQYEAQQDERRENIDTINGNALFNRELDGINAQTVINNTTAIKESLEGQNGVTPQSPAEKEVSDTAIEKGASLSSEAGYLTAEQARAATQARIWSTLEVVPLINSAVGSGAFSVSVASMSNTCAYLLAQDGYNLTLKGDNATFSPSLGEATITDIIISWDKRTPIEEKEEEKSEK